MPSPAPFDLYSLVRAAYAVDEKDLDQAQKTASHLNVPLHDVLLGRKLITKEKLGEMISKSLGIGYIDLRTITILKEVLDTVKEDVARERKVVPFARDGYILHLAMEDPQDLETINFVRKITGLTIIPFFSFDKDIKYGLHQYKSSLSETFKQLMDQAARLRGETATLQELAQDVSIVEAVKQMLEFAVVEGASDIHIEALADLVLVRYRIDGVLHDMITLPRDLHPAIIARVKILSSLKLDETRLPQDGRIKFESEEGDVISLRVSILPTVEGEKVVLRLLESGGLQFSLEDLGYDPISVGIIKRALLRPHGLILLTGPTGSGKTTSLYTMLNLLNTDAVNISTIEDPVEDRIRRINQTQVNAQINFNFAEGLRSLLRQDPDVVMVGEIRDSETARMAINAAMTGHLVLSTLHTNDAPGAIPRLIDLGAEPFLIASTLDVVIAQRLVRKLCPRCKVKKPVDAKLSEYFTGSLIEPLEKEAMMKLVPSEVYEAQGCDYCGYTGYLGRTGVYELFEVNDEIRQLILERVTASKIKEAALRNGMKSMMADGLIKVAAGQTTIAEILRVAYE
ncbi:MAG: type IV-A pilus assembly ATPase PilB, type IV pilus assembly protein PilB [Candidatus Collierbacteria bacterium GW2011_GWC1_45_47]|uniref:Type II secretion system protein E (GspE) n=6 Tax=Candidatus Collieribacteriota TaxID=1752725 RepID=A0A0G1JRY1_9BACT|nr:MAG: Type II secretion system protein E (GspE) [Candidatus Collierbacteria bacterium GW2011_GWF1_44_12]KKT46662.1 MAG: Type II secretion system protein E (GspE) [Candidatus Collierbacteria bacterium GW2011_GWF2_44_15]KKT67953.1 MAG: Type II secretion system protein E (GspE) [Candidatus Collierbacteria bacterium GW2011_GWB1_44_35]KKU00318.1 MAG: Type II secretion system protein E (GspE) [Candidatus Collierbacteria bacterium GW2011_GWC2_45_15]KKU09539.1 MAG: type IV-A pilus assembly ATPase Pil